MRKPPHSSVRLLSASILVLLALNFVVPSLRPALGFNGESASTVVGQPDFVTSLNPSGGLKLPSNLAFDSSGNLWVADAGHNRVLEETSPGVRTTTGTVLGQSNLLSEQPSLSQAGIDNPSGIAFDSSGNLWITDTNNNRVMEYAAPLSSGESTTVVLGQSDFTTSGLAPSESGMTNPAGVAFDPSGNLWVADTFNNRVLEFAAPFSTGMQASVVFGQPNFTSASLATSKMGMNAPTEVSFSRAGNLWVADSFNNRVLEFAPPLKAGGVPTFVLGQSDFSSNLDGGQASLALPSSVTFDQGGNLWTADEVNNRVVDFPSPVSNDENATVAIGQPSLTLDSPGGGKNGLTVPFDAVFDGSGNLWVSDSGNNRVLEYSAPLSTGMNASLVIGQPDFTTRTNGTSASKLNFPAGLAFESSGNLWVADAGNSRVLEFKPPFTNGMSASLVIGQADFISSTPGVSASRLYAPFAVAFDGLGNLYVADGGNSRVLGFATPFSTDESATLVLGQANFNSRSPNFSQASLNIPESLAFDHSGNLWVADSANDRVMEFSTLSNGARANVVLGQSTFTTNAPGTSQTTMNTPQGVGVDPAGNVWAADTSNNRLLEFPTVTSSTTSTTTSSTTSKTTTTTTTLHTTSTSTTTTTTTSSTTTTSHSTSSTTSTTSQTPTTSTSSTSTTTSTPSTTTSVSSAPTTVTTSTPSTSTKSSTTSTSSSSSTAASSSSSNGTYYLLGGVAVAAVVIILAVALVRRNRQP